MNSYDQLEQDSCYRADNQSSTLKNSYINTQMANLKEKEKCTSALEQRTGSEAQPTKKTVSSVLKDAKQNLSKGAVNSFSSANKFNNSDIN